MVAFIMRLEISSYDSYSCLGMANHNAGFSRYVEPELNIRPPLYPFLLTPVAALQYLGVSPQAVIKAAQFYCPDNFFCIYWLKLSASETFIASRVGGPWGFAVANPKADKNVVLSGDEKYFEQIQEITLFRHQAEKFR